MPRTGELVSYYKEKIRQLEEEKSRIGLWAQVFSTPLGVKAIKEFKRRCDAARDLYSLIPPSHPDAITMLIEAQHAERFHRQLVQSVEDAQQREKDIDKEIEVVLKRESRSQRVRRESDVVYTGDEE